MVWLQKTDRFLVKFVPLGYVFKTSVLQYAGSQIIHMDDIARLHRANIFKNCFNFPNDYVQTWPTFYLRQLSL